MGLYLLLIIFVLFPSLCQSLENNKLSCSWKSPKGNYYDLSKLTNNSQDYYIPKDSYPNQEWDVWINVCRGIVNPLCGSDVIACQEWDANNPLGHASMGEASSQQFESSENGVILQYIAGSDERETEIDFTCDSNTGIGYPKFVKENPQHHYIFSWKTQYACSQCGGTNQYDCQSCTSKSSCEWCLDNNSCTVGGDTSCSSYISNPKFCPEGCEQYKNCNDCTNSNCSWCLDNQSCISHGNFNCKNRVSENKYCNLNE